MSINSSNDDSTFFNPRGSASSPQRVPVIDEADDPLRTVVPPPNHQNHTQNHHPNHHNHNHHHHHQASSSGSGAAGSSTATATVTTFVKKDYPGGTTVQTRSNENETFIKKTKDVSDLEKIKKLKELFDLGLITEVEYTDRKSQLIDEITGTKSGKNRNKYRAAQVTITNKPPPDFSQIPDENATRLTFSTTTGRWVETRIKVKVDSVPFAKGGLRLSTIWFHPDLVHFDNHSEYWVSGDTNFYLFIIGKAYHLQFKDEEKGSVTYVGKMAIDPEEDRDTYFQDAEMQMYAIEWAKRFNQAHPPKPIEFVKVWILELVDRPNRPLCAVEPYIAGSYRKHNNNFGYVNEDERNTPQAFSHFTYEASSHQVLVCDVQGVDDMYTDPQIHTITGIGFGKGNLGARGFEKFIESHRCNAICRFLKLPSINAKLMDVGTIPNTPYMAYQRVNVLNVNMPPSSNLQAHLSSTPLLGETTRKQNRSESDSLGCSCTIL